MAQPEKYVFVCLNQRPAGHPKGSCLDRGADDVFNAMRDELGRRLMTNVKVVASGCVEGCLAGPTVLVVPGVVNERQSYGSTYEIALQSMREAAGYAESHGIRLGVENVWNRFLLTPREMGQFLTADDFNA